jgi:hypothetical protein
LRYLKCIPAPRGKIFVPFAVPEYPRYGVERYHTTEQRP